MSKINGTTVTRDASKGSASDTYWKTLMKKFSDANKETCQTALEQKDMTQVHRAMKELPTKSKYEGTWDLLGMSGVGTYTFPNGVVYKGDFEDGEFHGAGCLYYGNGAYLHGKFEKGRMTERTLVFSDGLEYTEDGWKYCRYPDRRFTIEYEEGLAPAGGSFLTADYPEREVPPGLYDTGDGFYDPKTAAVYKYHDPTSVIRAPMLREQTWILSNCRTSTDEPLGPSTPLYEQWTEPQLHPQPPPPPAALTRNRDGQESQEFNFEDFEDIPLWRQSTHSSGSMKLKFYRGAKDAGSSKISAEDQ